MTPEMLVSIHPKQTKYTTNLDNLEQELTNVKTEIFNMQAHLEEVQNTIFGMKFELQIGTQQHKDLKEHLDWYVTTNQTLIKDINRLLNVATTTFAIGACVIYFCSK